MLEQVAEVVRNLSSSPHARAEVCEAAKTISNASMAILYEPTGASGLLRSTSMAGIETEPIEIAPRRALQRARGIPLRELAVLRREQRVRSSSRARYGSSPAIPPRSCSSHCSEAQSRSAYSSSAGPGGQVGGSRTTTIALLAHEVAAVIERADMLTQLADIASTDALTGLPNRRAWDTHLAQTLTKDQHVTIAMLDLDHFKDYNDTYGHPAGRPPAAGRRQRPGARSCAPEISSRGSVATSSRCLLPNCNAANALEVVERLRQRIPSEQSCSAGIAGHGPESPPRRWWPMPTPRCMRRRPPGATAPA